MVSPICNRDHIETVVNSLGQSHVFQLRSRLWQRWEAELNGYCRTTESSVTVGAFDVTITKDIQSSYVIYSAAHLSGPIWSAMAYSHISLFSGLWSAKNYNDGLPWQTTTLLVLALLYRLKARSSKTHADLMIKWSDISKDVSNLITLHPEMWVCILTWQPGSEWAVTT